LIKNSHNIVIPNSIKKKLKNYITVKPVHNGKARERNFSPL